MTPRRVSHEPEARILVTGASSQLASTLIGELLSRGHAARALVRAGDFRASFVAPIDMAVGELTDPPSLTRAMDGVDRLLLLSQPDRDEVQMTRNAIEAARRADVQLIVRVSMLGASPSSPAVSMRNHGLSDRLLESAGIPHVILRPNLLSQTIIGETIPSIDADGRFLLNAGTARISMVDARDVAAVAAVALTEPGHEGRIYELTGPEALSYSEVARRLTRAIGWPTTYVDAPDDAMRERLLARLGDEWMANAGIELFQEYRRSGAFGYAAAITETVERLTGSAPRTLDALIAEWLPDTPPAA
jgi:uncharacterized protein YbjT (DUF2867 family)